jgi:hypothetical protein
MENNDISEVDYIGNDLAEITYSNNQKETVKLTLIATRQEAINRAIELTKQALLKNDAFEKLHLFKNDFSNLRNYEIGMYLDKLTGRFGNRIIDVCPFNGFSTYFKFPF